MASSSGNKDSGTRTMGKSLTRQMTRQMTRPDMPEEEVPPPADSELVPSSLASTVVPILRVANEIEPENPRVAYLCNQSLPSFITSSSYFSKCFFGYCCSFYSNDNF